MSSLQFYINRLTMKQNKSMIIPASHTQAEKQLSYVKPVYRSYETKIKSYKIEIIYTSRVLPTLKLKIIDLNSMLVYEIELNDQSLIQMDAAVIATFETLQAMYNEIVEIIKEQPDDIQLLDRGLIKVKVTVAMKSSIRKRDLILESQQRQITQYEQLKLKMQKDEEQNEKKFSQLKKTCKFLEKELQQSRNENKDLKIVIQELKKQLKKDVEEIKEKMLKEKSSLHAIISELRQSVKQLQDGMSLLNFTVRMLREGKKISLTPDERSKCLRPYHKQNTFNLTKNDRLTAVKVGRQKWGQIVCEQTLKEVASFYEVVVQKTKNKYICLGFCSKNCLQQEDSKWSKQAITLFLLDHSIICEGKQMKNQEGVGEKEKNQPQNTTYQMIVTINLSTKIISWYQNQILVSFVQFSDSFLNLCKKGDVSPLIICADHDDQITFK